MTILKRVYTLCYLSLLRLWLGCATRAVYRAEIAYRCTYLRCLSHAFYRISRVEERYQVALKNYPIKTNEMGVEKDEPKA